MLYLKIEKKILSKKKPQPKKKRVKTLVLGDFIPEVTNEQPSDQTEAPCEECTSLSEDNSGWKTDQSDVTCGPLTDQLEETSDEQSSPSKNVYDMQAIAQALTHDPTYDTDTTSKVSKLNVSDHSHVITFYRSWEPLCNSSLSILH